jgi:hypothetical protein
MKSAQNLLMAVVFVILPIAAVGWPDDEVRVTGLLTTAKQDGPLQIVGFKLPEKIGQPAMIVVRNVSSKNILEFTVQVVAGNPEERSTAGNASVPISRSLPGLTRSSFFFLPRWRKEGSIPPGGEDETREHGLESVDFVTAARFLRSNCVHLLAMVDRVVFADGTDWKSSLSDEKLRQVWKESISPESLKSCANSPEVARLLEELRGESFNQGRSPTQIETAIVQHYSISCPLRRVQGKLLAVCPM